MTRNVLMIALPLLASVGCSRAPNAVSANTNTPAANNPAAPQAQPAPAPVFTIPAGTEVRVRLDQSLDTKRNRPGQAFAATLVSPVAIGGEVVLAKGTPFTGRIVEARESGHLTGRAVMELDLVSFQLNGVTYPIETRADVRTSGSHKKRNFAFIGGGSGGGAAIGAIAGGGAGALIGAGAGAAAGVTTAFFTGRKNVSLPAETPLAFSLRDQVQVSAGS